MFHCPSFQPGTTAVWLLSKVLLVRNSGAIFPYQDQNKGFREIKSNQHGLQLPHGISKTAENFSGNIHKEIASLDMNKYNLLFVKDC